MGCKRAQPAWLLRWFAAMLLYYRSAGANAMLALLLNGILLGAALSCLGAVLTLPGAGRWFLQSLRHPGGYPRDYAGLVRVFVLLRNSGSEGIRHHFGNRPDDKPVHIRLRVASSVRLGIVEARTIPRIERWDASVDRYDWYACSSRRKTLREGAAPRCSAKYLLAYSLDDVMKAL